MRAGRKRAVMLHFFHAVFSQAMIQSSTWHALLKKKLRCGGSLTCMYKHLCAGQVPLTDAEAQALKKSRQTPASQDWLMGAEPIEREATACQDSGKTLLTLCNTRFAQTRSVLPEPQQAQLSCAVSHNYMHSRDLHPTLLLVPLPYQPSPL